MKRPGWVLLGLAWAAYAGAVGAQNAAAIDPAAAKKAVELCSACHGPYGISTSADFPILAAQREGYLDAQIEAFRSHTRAEKDAHDISAATRARRKSKRLGNALFSQRWRFGQRKFAIASRRSQ